MSSVSCAVVFDGKRIEIEELMLEGRSGIGVYFPQSQSDEAALYIHCYRCEIGPDMSSIGFAKKKCMRL